jgi:hypothetical protein
MASICDPWEMTLLARYTRTPVRNWAVGAALSFLMLWIGTAPFLSDRAALSYVPSLNAWLPPEGSTVHCTHEGWARSHVYGLGLIGGEVPAREQATSCVAIWGDSFVEGAGVADREKVANQANGIARSRGSNITFVGIGLSGRDAGDYFFLLPRYEVSIPAIIEHYVVLPTIRDVLPRDLPRPGRTFGRRGHVLEFNERIPRHAPDWYNGYVGPLRLMFVRRLAKRSLASIRGIDFIGQKGSQKGRDRGPRSSSRADASLRKAWEFMLSEMKARSRGGITFVYAPLLPTLVNGSFNATNPELHQVNLFKEVCHSMGIGFIDMTRSFVCSALRDGKPPHGLVNGFPAKGHWNRTGHRLVAEWIADDCLRMEE